MQTDSGAAASPRSKLEYMYRDMLAECERVSARNETLASQIHEASTKLMTLPALLRNAASMVAEQASSDAHRHMQQATTALLAADESLRRSSQTLHRASVHNARFIACVAGLCGLLGGLLGALVMIVASQG